MLRLPSAQKPYDDYFSGDPAFTQLPEDASPDAIDDRNRLVMLARKTGDWSALTIVGEKPTRFGMRIIPSEPLRVLQDMKDRDGVNRYWISLCFRCAVIDVTGLGDVQIRRGKHPQHSELGVIAGPEVCDLLQRVSGDIVDELGLAAYVRSVQPDPT